MLTHSELFIFSSRFQNIMDKIHLMTSVRDEETMTQYAYFNEGGGLVSFDDEQSICDKTEYAMDNALHGYVSVSFSAKIYFPCGAPYSKNVRLILHRSSGSYLEM